MLALHTFRECTPKTLSNPKSKLPTASKEEILDWVAAGWRDLQQQTDLIKKSFVVTGISGTKQQIRKDDILKSAKTSADEDSDGED